VDQDGHGQHGHGRILINDAAKQQNPTSHVRIFFLKVAIDMAGKQKKIILARTKATERLLF
jgi:hypothetical protein